MEDSWAEHFVLLIDGGEGRLDELADRLRGLAIGSLRADTPEQAQEVLRGGEGAISAILIVADPPTPELRQAVDALRSSCPSEATGIIVVGPKPDKKGLKLLRKAKLEHGLWEPFDDGALRFQMNRVFARELESDHRRATRVPTYVLARIAIAGRSREAIVYSLSETGAFLETPRALMPGAILELELRLPLGTVVAEAEVVHSNVVGNVQRPNTPLGMGVRFTKRSAAANKAITAYVQDQARKLAL